MDILAIQVSLKSFLQHQQSKSMNSLVLSFLSGSTLTSIYDYWKNHSFDYKGRTFSAKWCFCFFNILSRFVLDFLPRSRCLNFMTAVTICSDFEAQENKVYYCFHFFPQLFPPIYCYKLPYTYWVKTR